MFSVLNLIFSLLSRITKDWVSAHCFLTPCRNSVILVLSSRLSLPTLQLPIPHSSETLGFFSLYPNCSSFYSIGISLSSLPHSLLTSQLLIVRSQEGSADSWALVGQVQHPQSWQMLECLIVKLDIPTPLTISTSPLPPPRLQLRDWWYLWD